MVRVFIGIVLPEGIKRYVTGIQERLKMLPIKAKFVEPENLHISLSFLGEVTDVELEKVKFQLDEISKSYKRFEVALGELTLIPNEKFVRVVALNTKSEILEALRKEVVKAVLGKSYNAHLTLVRVKAILDKGRFLEEIKKLDFTERKFEVNSLCLVESILRISGPIYKILHQSYLK